MKSNGNDVKKKAKRITPERCNRKWHVVRKRTKKVEKDLLLSHRPACNNAAIIYGQDGWQIVLQQQLLKCVLSSSA